jgi:hypothetical protein
MDPLKKILTAILIISLISGCAVSKSRFLLEANSLADLEVCRAYIRDFDKLGRSYQAKDEEERQYLDLLYIQAAERLLVVSTCEDMISEDNNKTAMIGLAILGVAAVAYSAAQSQGGSTSSAGYAWDAFYDQNYNLLWRCRNKSNGQFAYDSMCSNQLKNDYTWPSK